MAARRSDGLKLISWREGRCLTWNDTVTHTRAPSYLSISPSSPAAAAEAAAKCGNLSNSFVSSNRFRDSGLINQAWIDILSTRLSRTTDDPRETFFFQRLSVVIQRLFSAQSKFFDIPGHTKICYMSS